MSSNITTNENREDYIYYTTDLYSSNVKKISKTNYNNINDLEDKICYEKYPNLPFYEVLYREAPVSLYFNVIIKDINNFDIKSFDTFYKICHDNKSIGKLTISGYIKDIYLYEHILGWCDRLSVKVNSWYYNELIYDINYLNKNNINDFKDKYANYKNILNNNYICNLHIVYTCSYINYSILNDFCKGNIVLNEKYKNINNIIDKSCYKNNQKFELFYIYCPYDADSVSETDINYNYQLIQSYIPKNIKYSKLDVFVNKSNNQIIKTTNKETDSDSSYSSYDDTAEMLFGNENKQTETSNNNISNNTITQIPKLLSEEIIKLKQYIKELLNLVCKYKGFGNAYNEIMNYIPYNEKSMYGTTYFFDVYNEEYNSIDHNTPEDIDKIYYNKYNRGLCSCLSKIDNYIYYNYYDKTDNSLYYKYMNKLKYIYNYYRKHYRYDNSKSSINKYNNKIIELENKYNAINKNKQQNIRNRDIEDINYSLKRKQSKKYKYYYSFKIIKKQDKDLYIKYNETNNILIKNYSIIHFDNLNKHIKEYYDKYLFKNVLDNI